MEPHRRHVWMTIIFAVIGVLAALVAAAMLLFGMSTAAPMALTAEPSPMAAATPALAATEPPPTPTALPSATPAPTLVARTPLSSVSTPTISAPTPPRATSTALPQTGGPESLPPTPTEAPPATVEMPTPAPVEPPGPSHGETPVAEVPAAGGGPGAAMARTFTLLDEAGNSLGTGQVSVYAPSQLAVGEAGEIRVEITVNTALPTAATLPEATVTPSGGAAHPTPTLPALIDSQTLEVREYMGAGLRGLDLGHFRYEAIPANGLLHMRAGAPNVWRWTITPAGAEAVGINRLEVYIYLPQTRSDGTAFNEETNTIPLTITVPGTAPQKGGQLGILIAALVAVGGAGGAFAGAAQYVRARRAAGPPPPAADDEPGKPFDLDVDGDVSGSLTVAGDDVITYQTIVQNAPTVLIVGLIIGLVALVAGLAVIVIVLVP